MPPAPPCDDIRDSRDLKPQTVTSVFMRLERGEVCPDQAARDLRAIRKEKSRGLPGYLESLLS